MVISSCSLAEARLLLDNFLKASIDKVGGAAGLPADRRLQSLPWAGTLTAGYPAVSLTRAR